MLSLFPLCGMDLSLCWPRGEACMCEQLTVVTWLLNHQFSMFSALKHPTPCYSYVLDLPVYKPPPSKILSSDPSLKITSSLSSFLCSLTLIFLLRFLVFCSSALLCPRSFRPLSQALSPLQPLMVLFFLLILPPQLLKDLNIGIHLHLIF